MHADIVDVRHDYSIESGAPGRADPRCRSKVQVACPETVVGSYGLKSKRGGSVPSKRLLVSTEYMYLTCTKRLSDVPYGLSY